MSGVGSWAISDVTSLTGTWVEAVRTSKRQLTLPADLREKIMGFVRPRNWDGEGARAITRATCLDAVALAEEVHTTVRGLPWPLAGVMRWGVVALTWQVEDLAVTVYLPRERSGKYCYQWEGPGFLCGEAEGSRHDVIGAVAGLNRWQTA